MKPTLHLFCLFLFAQSYAAVTWQLPINSANRQSFDGMHLTDIGRFGLMRKARPGIPAHHHTGADLKRPGSNYSNEPIFPAAAGRVISLRNDGAFAQIIIEHRGDTMPIWTVYEHIAGISVACGDCVYPDRPIARFMTKAELDKLGWQFDHVHFEVMKSAPKPLKPDQTHPTLFYSTYCLVCYNTRQLAQHYYNPLDFLAGQWKKNATIQTSEE